MNYVSCGFLSMSIENLGMLYIYYAIRDILHIDISFVFERSFLNTSCYNLQGFCSKNSGQGKDDDNHGGNGNTKCQIHQEAIA